VLDATEAIERKAGRTSKGDLRPRPLDLDLLAAWTVSGDSPLRIEPLAPLATPRLTLPHPRLATRRFALVPLADVAPDWPVALDLGKPPSTPRTLLAALERAGPRDSTDVAGGPASPRFPFRAPVMACFAASPATPRGRA
jgi:7,8-dihydro-6-hydroxymethylpterin-pyrophosphokinase